MWCFHFANISSILVRNISLFHCQYFLFKVNVSTIFLFDYKYFHCKTNISIKWHLCCKCFPWKYFVGSVTDVSNVRHNVRSQRNQYKQHWFATSIHIYRIVIWPKMGRWTLTQSRRFLLSCIVHSKYNKLWEGKYDGYIVLPRYFGRCPWKSSRCYKKRKLSTDSIAAGNAFFNSKLNPANF